MGDPKTMDCVRELGGYMAVLSKALDAVLKLEDDNPRFVRPKAAIVKSLRMQMPRMRESIQQLLASRAWKLLDAVNKGTSLTLPIHSEGRYPLPQGSHLEVDLVDRSMMWRGRADLVTITSGGCSVVDWKTGEESEDHHRQMEVYALLWDGDSELNPSRLPTESLKLSYGGNTVEVAVPHGEQLIELKRIICEGTEKVRAELELDPVPARPSADNCRFCQVKLICNDCWSWNQSSTEKKDAFNDLELVLINATNESSWSAESNLKTVGIPTVLLKRSQCDDGLWSALQPGMKLRMTDAMVTFREDGEQPLVAFTTFTEALLLAV